MRISKIAFLLIAYLGLNLVPRSFAQYQAFSAQARNHLDVALNYQTMHSNPVWSGDNFWTHGGSAEISAQIWHGLGVVGEVSGLHSSNVNTYGIGLDIITFAFGPRYTISHSRRRFSVHGQTLLGEAYGMNSVFPATAGATDSAQGRAFFIGGGADYSLRHHLSLRLLEANWLRTQLPNGTTNVQNNLLLGAGIVFHLRQ